VDWIDISMPLRNGVVGWPGDVPVELARRATIGQGSDYNISMITLSTHAGTHMDAPLHFIRGGMSIDMLPFDATVGPARVVEIEDTESIKPAELERLAIVEGERILFKTSNSNSPWPDLDFQDGYVHISPEGAEFLVEKKVRCVAIDYLSVGSLDMACSVPTHTTLLAGGVWIIECVYLGGVQPGHYELICLPLRVEGAEGAPARAIIRPLT
jgi:arylformamidase